MTGALPQPDASGLPAHVDVVVIGAGLAGIGAACRLRESTPDLSLAILEARDAIGGTWDQFRYPGVRSDSDMYTFSYPFRPWNRSETLAAGADIRDYIRETAAEWGIDRHIHFGVRVTGASWDTTAARWTLTCRTETAETVVTCTFVHCCTGYFDYEHSHQPEWDGLDDFEGTLVHPQFWPEDLDLAGRRVVVVGSGATAVTLVPSLIERAAHVTMVQRSPTYLVPMPMQDRFARLAARALPARQACRVARLKKLLTGQGFYELCRSWPRLARFVLLAGVQYRLRDPTMVAEHFTPSYAPWDQRLCVTPEGELFRQVRTGTASIVTDRIERFLPEGLRLGSGTEIPADVVVSATGLRMLPLGGIALDLDGSPVDLPTTVVYRGFMLSGVPNLAFAIGYVNASWTLRTDLTARYVGTVLRHLRATNADVVTPPAPPAGEQRPMIEMQAGYVTRSIASFPRQGSEPPWRLGHNYLRDRLDALRIDLTAELDFHHSPTTRPLPESAGRVSSEPTAGRRPDAEHQARTAPHVRRA